MQSESIYSFGASHASLMLRIASSRFSDVLSLMEIVEVAAGFPYAYERAVYPFLLYMWTDCIRRDKSGLVRKFERLIMRGKNPRFCFGYCAMQNNVSRVTAYFDLSASFQPQMLE
jgi:hypothetical protein